MSRVEGLQRVLRAVREARHIGTEVTHHGHGEPCCALGHAMGPRTGGQILTTVWPDDVAAILGISENDAQTIANVNDLSAGSERRENLIECLEAMIREAVVRT